MRRRAPSLLLCRRAFFQSLCSASFLSSLFPGWPTASPSTLGLPLCLICHLLLRRFLVSLRGSWRWNHLDLLVELDPLLRPRAPTVLWPILWRHGAALTFHPAACFLFVGLPGQQALQLRCPDFGFCCLFLLCPPRQWRRLGGYEFLVPCLLPSLIWDRCL